MHLFLLHLSTHHPLPPSFHCYHMEKKARHAYNLVLHRINNVKCIACSAISHTIKLLTHGGRQSSLGWMDGYDSHGWMDLCCIGNVHAIKLFYNAAQPTHHHIDSPSAPSTPPPGPRSENRLPLSPSVSLLPI